MPISLTAAQTGAYDISFTEALLTAVTNAVEKTDAGECNEGFLRSAAMLHIVMLSDECEQSPNPYLRTQWQYVDRIVAQKEIRIWLEYQQSPATIQMVGNPKRLTDLILGVYAAYWRDVFKHLF